MYETAHAKAIRKSRHDSRFPSARVDATGFRNAAGGAVA